jgi:hypothetical protein
VAIRHSAKALAHVQRVNVRTETLMTLVKRCFEVAIQLGCLKLAESSVREPRIGMTIGGLTVAHTMSTSLRSSITDHCRESTVPAGSEMNLVQIMGVWTGLSCLSDRVAGPATLTSGRQACRNETLIGFRIALRRLLPETPSPQIGALDCFTL